ncbi:septal ring lytic transglycosylase RlpA [Tamilnaduibacter salinus]|uniref:Endolytic peptidoglycan transglycosylase RlpA n=1 Tax=Tamilnaduibacter salinus TaxID=1484056 RepID=A0A2A2I342_9GAMM|nr:septal ring lytic transglycosylase RlpA family protein [Tamilnaduibacter salinus]PAV26002.1 septal ring lytic transglycosylase RlpA [Tamilnaduibacter salinus]
MKAKADMRVLVVWLLVGLVAGCASTPDSSSRYDLAQDRGPSGNPDVSELENAVPRYEPRTSAGNKSPYTVWGEQYTVMSDASARNYVQRGRASWYGEKFHGHRTSNGEIFDMYAMSAAHKRLPLPSFARVTNLENGRQVIVRVNDRGPFHEGRIIDLSWAAARKLGFSDHGTARVEVASVTVSPDGQRYVAGSDGVSEAPDEDGTPASAQALFVQVASFTQPGSAQRLSQRLRQAIGEAVRVRTAGPWHRVQVGPFSARSEAESHRGRIERQGFGRPIVVTAPN